MRTLAAILVFLVGSAIAQEYKPFPQARITAAQWQQYFTEVSSRHAGARRDFGAQNLVVFEDSANLTSYAFTASGHPAHPAWITRKFIKQPSGAWSVQQIGYFAGAEDPFARLFRSYQEMNAQIQAEAERRAAERKK